MMSNDIAGDSEHGTNSSRRLRDEELSADDLHQIEIGALSQLRAQEILRQRDAKAKQDAAALRRSQVGVYFEKRSLLMPTADYIKLVIFIALATIGYFGIKYLLQYSFESKPALLDGYMKQLNFGVIAFVVMMVWLVLRIYHLWASDSIYADVDRIHRTRKPIWYLGITKISFQVNTMDARCNPEPTNLEMALRNIGFDASTVDIDTPIQKDKPLHDLKFVKKAKLLETIINF